MKRRSPRRFWLALRTLEHGDEWVSLGATSRREAEREARAVVNERKGLGHRLIGAWEVKEMTVAWCDPVQVRASSDAEGSDDGRA